MLNIDSEPMATPMTNPRRAKKLRSTSGASARDSTASSRKNAVAASANGPTTGSGAAPACGSACSPKTSDTINVASKTKPIQSARRLCVPAARAVAEPAEARPAMAVNMSSDVEPEDHAPACDVSEHAAEQRPDAEAKHQEPGPSADRCCPALWRRTGVDRSQSAGHRDRCAQGLARPVRPAAQLVCRQGQ